jgi:hypothetical protein
MTREDSALFDCGRWVGHSEGPVAIKSGRDCCARLVMSNCILDTPLEDNATEAATRPLFFSSGLQSGPIPSRTRMVLPIVSSESTRRPAEGRV